MKENELKSYKEILISKQAELLGIAEDTLTRMSKMVISVKLSVDPKSGCRA